LIKGRGVTVQVNSKIFGFIEVSEITDDISGNVFKFLQKKAVFAARVIDHDKNGKIQLCTRESVIDNDNWNNMKPEGTTVSF
jgi:predicted RNA-binding protein with RPS1 domain